MKIKTLWGFAYKGILIKRVLIYKMYNKYFIYSIDLFSLSDNRNYLRKKSTYHLLGSKYFQCTGSGDW